MSRTQPPGISSGAFASYISPGIVVWAKFVAKSIQSCSVWWSTSHRPLVCGVSSKYLTVGLSVGLSVASEGAEDGLVDGLVEGEVEGLVDGLVVGSSVGE